MFTLRPTRAPKARSSALLKPKAVRGLNLNSTLPNIQSTRSICSLRVYFTSERLLSIFRPDIVNPQPADPMRVARTPHTPEHLSQWHAN